VVVPCSVRVKLLAFTVEESIASEKVAVTLAPTATPVAPSWGANPLTLGAVVSIVQVRLAGVASVLPAASVALTSKVCCPAERLV
jgi:hypothetical protein